MLPRLHDMGNSRLAGYQLEARGLKQHLQSITLCGHRPQYRCRSPSLKLAGHWLYPLFDYPVRSIGWLLVINVPWDRTVINHHGAFSNIDSPTLVGHKVNSVWSGPANIPPPMSCEPSYRIWSSESLSSEKPPLRDSTDRIWSKNRFRVSVAIAHTSLV